MRCGIMESIPALDSCWRIGVVFYFIHVHRRHAKQETKIDGAIGALIFLGGRWLEGYLRWGGHEQDCKPFATGQ